MSFANIPGRIGWKAISRLAAILEPALLAVMLAAFWQPSPQRDPWLALLLLLPPLWAARAASGERWRPDTPLDGLLLAFAALGVLNVAAAPYTRGLLMLGRPLLGMALVVYFAALARQERSAALLSATVGLALGLAVAALGATQWNIKAEPFYWLVERLPDLTGLPGLAGGFNANEIGGALSLLLPPAAALTVARSGSKRLRAGAALAFSLLMLALLLGQSRLAFLGSVAGLALVVRLLIPPGRGRCLAWAGLIAVCLLEAAIILRPLDAADRLRLRDRDEASFSQRIGIWGSAAAILRDYPLTGVGMGMFRAAPVRARYPAAGYENRVLPHAHNAWLQIGSDLGLPGLAIFTGWYAAAGWMLRRGCRRDGLARAAAVGVAGGLLAHAIFSLGDAIPLWDRLGFVFWWVLALAAALFNRPDDGP